MLTGRKLLLADDSPTVQKVLSLIFGDEGMEVSVVGSGAEALTALAQGAPDIVLADVHMPEPDGYQVCEHVKRTESLRHIPVLLLRGTFEPFDEAEARRVGADGVFMTKPFQSIRELMSKVGNLLGGHAEEKRPDEPAALEAPATAREPATELRPQAHAARAASDAAAPAYPWERARAEDMATSAAPEPAASVGAFNDFDMDDQTIQTTPAAAFGMHAVPAAAASAEYDMQEVEAEREVMPAHGNDESFVMHDEESPVVAAQAQTESMAALSYTDAATAPSEFSTRTAYVAAADDALLDLGESVASSAAQDADEFVLDLDDESYAAPLPVEPAPSMVYAEGLATSAAEAAAPLLAAEAPRTDVRALEADAPAYAPQFDEPPVATEETSVAASDETTTAANATDEAPSAMPYEAQASYMHEAGAPAGAWHEPTAHEPAAQSTSAPAAESAEMLAPAPVAETVGEQGSAAGLSQDSAAQLSPEMIDAIARRVVELMSDSVVREVAWEVVPDLAERLIHRRLEEERTRAQ